MGMRDEMRWQLVLRWRVHWNVEGWLFTAGVQVPEVPAEQSRSIKGPMVPLRQG